MAQSIVGPGVIVNNATLNCPTASYGTFTGTSNLGLTSGIVLTTGNSSQVAGAASNGFLDMNALSYDNGATIGDPNLTAIESNASYNTCILEFDVIPICDTLQLSYVFASEEYPEYVCSSYNDVFGFFISGPNPQGGNYNSQNIAVIPGTSIAVAINSINPGSAGANSGGGTCTSLAYNSLYVNNSSGTTVAYDAFTLPMMASVPVTTCQTYHLKLAIADAGDPWLDSGVFLEQGGLTCPGTTVSIAAIGDTATEGCVNGSIQITRGGDLTAPLSVTLTFTGSATNGSDYTLTSSITFGTGQSVITLNVPATADGNTEGTEIATITGSYNICGTSATTNPVNITITEGPQISFSSTTPGCGNSNGSITATPSGGTSPYTYIWSTTPVQTTATATGLIAGNYSVTVTDANNCISDSSTTIGTTPSLNLTTSSTTVACNGGNNGTASVTASAGTAPYTYLWSTTPAQTSSTATGLTAGNYTVTVNDNSGCQTTATVAVNSQTAVTLTTSTVNVTCAGGNNGSASVTASGGSIPYSYSWSNGNNTSAINGLIAGTYAVTVNDSNNCPSVTSVTINDGAPNANATISPAGPFCINSAPATLTAATAGGTFTGNGISGNSFSPAIAGAGTHIITYTISSTCGDTDTVSIVVNPLPDPTINPIPNQCTSNAPATLTAATAGGTWSGTGVSSNTFNPSTAGAGTFTITYNVTISGCNASDSIYVTVSQNQDATITPAGPFCIGDLPATLTAVSSGGTWTGNGITNGSSGTFDAAVSGSGNHIITYSISSACGDTDTVMISVSDVSLLSSNLTNASCYGLCDGSITFNTSGATLFSIDNGATFQAGNIFTDLCNGNYSVIVKNTQGCADTAQITITEPPDISLNTFLSNNATCYDSCNGYAVVIPSGGTSPYYYNWSPTGNTPPIGYGQGTASAGKLCDGTFNLEVTDTNGCIKDTNFIITEPTQGFVLATGTATKCSGSCDGSANANALGGAGNFTFQWDGNTGYQTAQNASGLCAGTYIVTATDANLCPVVTTVIVPQPTPVTDSVSPGSTICIGGNAVISAYPSGGAGSYIYQWDNGSTSNSQVVSPTIPTCYSVIITDANNCQSPSQAVCIDIFPPVDVSAFTDMTICKGQSVELSANAMGGDGIPYTYSWSTGQASQVINVYPPGNFPDTVFYTVVGSDGCSPTDTDSVMITFYQIPTPVYSPPSAIGCAPDTVTFINMTQNAATCLWDMGDGNFVQNCGTFDYVYPNPGNYIVDLTIFTAEGCYTTVSPASLINVNPLPEANFSYTPENPTVVNTLVNFTNLSTGQVVLWDWTFYDLNNATLGTSQNINPEFTFPSDTGEYPVNLQVTTLSGCKDDTTIYIFIDNEFSLWIPNSFTPNGDGKNDFFPPKGIGINPDRFVLYIFDRWGDLIFESHNLDDPWDGTARELGGTEIVKQDVYVWKIVTEEATREKTEHRYIGHVTLLR